MSDPKNPDPRTKKPSADQLCTKKIRPKRQLTSFHLAPRERDILEQLGGGVRSHGLRELFYLATRIAEIEGVSLPQFGEQIRRERAKNEYRARLNKLQAEGKAWFEKYGNILDYLKDRG